MLIKNTEDNFKERGQYTTELFKNNSNFIVEQQRINGSSILKTRIHHAIKWWTANIYPRSDVIYSETQFLERKQD